MNMELHTKGASFIATQTADNPRDLVIDAIKMVPDGEVKEQFERFRTLLSECGDSYQRAVEWYFFVNMRDHLVNSRNRRPADPVERAEAKVQQQRRVENIKAQIVMLDLTMPNGKAMRDCTGSEMATFGNPKHGKCLKTLPISALWREATQRGQSRRWPASCIPMKPLPLPALPQQTAS
jgi:hypothetical protein